MNAIKPYEFDGRVFNARVIDEDEWFTAAQVAEMLGHEDANSVLHLGDVVCDHAGAPAHYRCPKCGARPGEFGRPCDADAEGARS